MEKPLALSLRKGCVILLKRSLRSSAGFSLRSCVLVLPWPLSFWSSLGYEAKGIRRLKCGKEGKKVEKVGESGSPKGGKEERQLVD